MQDVRLFFCPAFSWMARCSGRMVAAEEDRWKGRLNGSFTIHTDRSRLGLGSSPSNTSRRVGRAMDVHVDFLHRLVESDPRKTCLPHRPTTMGHPAPTPHPPLHPRDPRGAGRRGGEGGKRCVRLGGLGNVGCVSFGIRGDRGARGDGERGGGGHVHFVVRTVERTSCGAWR